MGLFDTMISGLPESKLDVRYGPVELWRSLFSGYEANSGVAVSVNTALQTTTVLACVRRIAEALMCPCKVYMRKEDGSRDEDRSFPLYDILNTIPNTLQDGLEFRETVGLHLALMFNSYSFISKVTGKDGRERIDELIPIPPQYVTAKLDRSSQSMSYTINWPDGGSAKLGAGDIWHIRGPAWEPGVGMDSIRLLREAIGLAVATEETHARYHANGAQPGTVITTEKDLSKKEIRDRLKEQFDGRIGGVAQKFKTLVLDNGMKLERMAPTGVEAQHLQLRQFQVEEICRGFCVMPIMVGYSGDKAPTFASAEQLFLQHLVHTVRPWQKRFAESADRWLLTKEDRAAGRYVGFVEADFLSPDMKTKAEYYKTALGGVANPGWVTPNQVRGFEEMPSHPGGDNLYAPAHSGPLNADGTVAVSAPEPTTTTTGS